MQPEVFRLIEKIRDVGPASDAWPDRLKSLADAPDLPIAGAARYYFNVRNGKQYPDETGQAFQSHQEAAAHGAMLAAELAQDGEWDGYMICVTDANGRIIIQIPVGK